jgi:hypothetical protein
MNLNKTQPEPIRLPERRVLRRRMARKPTPIRISVTAWQLILLGLAALLALILWAVPIVPAIALAGFAVALVLSFPVHLFAQHVPRSLAILLSFLILLAVVLLLAYILLPLIVSQAGALVTALPELVQNLEQYLVRALRALHARDLLPDTPGGGGGAPDLGYQGQPWPDRQQCARAYARNSLRNLQLGTDLVCGGLHRRVAAR